MNRQDIRIAKKWLAHFHTLHTNQPLQTADIDHAVGPKGKVTFSLKGNALLDPSSISPPPNFVIRTGRGD